MAMAPWLSMKRTMGMRHASKRPDCVMGCGTVAIGLIPPMMIQLVLGRLARPMNVCGGLPPHQTPPEYVGRHPIASKRFFCTLWHFLSSFERTCQDFAARLERSSSRRHWLVHVCVAHNIIIIIIIIIIITIIIIIIIIFSNVKRDSRANVLLGRAWYMRVRVLINLFVCNWHVLVGVALFANFMH